MQLKTPVKASAINNLTDARYFSAWGVEWLGFNMNFGDQNYLEPKAIKEIKEWLVGPYMVGEFVGNQSPEQIIELVTQLKLDMVQVGMFASVELIKELNGIAVIKEWILSDWSDLEGLGNQLAVFSANVEFFLLDLTKNGLTWEVLSQKAEALAQLQRLCKSYPIMLSIDFRAEDYNDLVGCLVLRGLSLQGNEEEKVGYKSFEELDAIFEILEIFI